MRVLELQESVVSTDLPQIAHIHEDTPSIPVGRYAGFEESQSNNPMNIAPVEDVRQYEMVSAIDSTIYDDVGFDTLRLWLVTVVAPHDDISFINSLPDDRYELIQSIPVKIERDPEIGWAAWFEEAQIAMPGSDPVDAKLALEDSIVDAFEDLNSEEEDLGPLPLKQLRVLRYYVRERVNDADDAGTRGKNSK